MDGYKSSVSGVVGVAVGYAWVVEWVATQSLLKSISLTF